MKKIINKSFKRELFLCFILVAIVPLVMSSYFLIQVFKSWIAQDYEQKTEKQLEQVEETMVAFLSQVEDATEQILYEPVILDGIIEKDSWVRNKAYKELYSITADMRDIAQFEIYDINGTCKFSTSAKGEIENLPPYWGILKVAKTHPDKMTLRRVSQYRISENVCLQGARAILDKNEECIGFIVVDVTQEHFEKILSNTYNEQNGIAILDGFWEDVYSTKTAKEEKLAQTLRSMRLSGENLRQTENGITFYIQPIADTELYIVLGRFSIFTQDVTDIMFGVMLVMTTISLILCLFAAGFMSNYMTEPVKQLTQAMHKVENGDLNTRIHSKRKDELGQLSRSFDIMTEEIKENVALQVKQQQELNDSNIAMMQAQLNPHFLYNTLDTMKWVAKANHIPELATLASGLAKILRTSISENKYITLEEEIRLVTSYMDIQKIRFNGNFSYDIEIEPELEECVVPKLIIQPIVENAIIHGLKESENGQIFINAYEQNDQIVIDVYDDGCGMSDEIMELLNSHDREKLKGHIGFYNVDTIIKLHYGEKYGLYAERVKTGGTKVQIVLPRGKADGEV